VKTTLCLVLPLFLCAAWLAPAANRIRAGEFSNPLMLGTAPHVPPAGKTVWLYTTTTADRFFVFPSDDLKTWEHHGHILHFKDVLWGRTTGAPATMRGRRAASNAAGSGYFYY
jgi:hypothetical protein